MLIYVCSPLRGNIENNVAKAKDYCKYVIEQGHIPIAPHVMYYGVLDDNIPQERMTGINIGNTLLMKCDELWYFGDTTSEGMKAEIHIATLLKIPTRRIK